MPTYFEVLVAHSINTLEDPGDYKALTIFSFSKPVTKGHDHNILVFKPRLLFLSVDPPTACIRYSDGTCSIHIELGALLILLYASLVLCPVYT